MNAVSWFQKCVCGLAVGGLMSVPLSLASDDPSVNNEQQTASDAKSKRRGNPKKPDAPKTDAESKADAPGERGGVSPPVVTPVADSKAESKSPPELPGSEPAFAKILFGNLTAEHMKSLGEMLEKDWKDRPEWGDMAVAILKNDFMRPGTGWWNPSAIRYDWNWLSERFDANKDGKIEREEFPNDIAKADQMFARLDRDGDEQLAPADFEDSDPMKSQMSNRLFDKFDFDSNGRVTQQEVTEFFRRADKDKSEFLTPDDWWLAIDPPAKRRASGDADAPAIGPYTPTAALRMLLRGEMGWLTSGPQLGDRAPDFTLPKHDGSGDITLSDSFGKRPVVLVFGSFT